MGYCHINTFTRPSRAYNNAGNLIQLNHTNNINENFTSASPAVDGDCFQLFFCARGNEVWFSISTYTNLNRPIWDLYVNGILDSAGYDDYTPAAGIQRRYIALTQPIREGYNIIELKVNGKNGASTGFILSVYGASIQ